MKLLWKAKMVTGVPSPPLPFPCPRGDRARRPLPPGAPLGTRCLIAALPRDASLREKLCVCVPDSEGMERVLRRGKLVYSSEKFRCVFSVRVAATCALLYS